MSSFSPSAMRLDISRTTWVRSASRCRWTAPSMTDSARPQFDYLIIGAGAAGCVLANRLSAGWGWKGVLPIFRRLETDQDFNGSSHGHDGPVPIRREPPTAWSPLAHAVRAAATHRGFPHIEDANADFRDGHCTLPNSRFER